jgi:Rrf2 family protein
MRSEQIAESANTNPAVIRKLFSLLAKAGLTSGQLGTGGGAILIRAPKDIKLIDVYNAVEDGELFSMHRSPPDQNCYVGSQIQKVLQPHFFRAKAAMEKELERVTLAEIVKAIVKV